MTNHYQDRKLVKQPKPIRFDEYQEQMILAKPFVCLLKKASAHAWI